MKNRHLFAAAALDKLLEYPGVQTVLDVGSGTGAHAQVMRDAGKEVTTISYIPPAHYVGDFQRYEGPKVDAIWASHVLEHQLNVHSFLTKCRVLLKDNGVLAITVPPAKHNVVGGHVNLFNGGTLLYNIILAGFDCSMAKVSPLYTSGVPFPYNISVIVRKREYKLPKDLHMDSGDIEKLAKFFPFDAKQSFDGQLSEGVNWD